MSELDRKQAWDGFLSLLREMRFDDSYKATLAAAYERYLAALKKDGFPIDDKIVILTAKGVVVIVNSEIPRLLRENDEILTVLRRVWGGIST